MRSPAEITEQGRDQAHRGPPHRADRTAFVNALATYLCASRLTVARTYSEHSHASTAPMRRPSATCRWRRRPASSMARASTPTSWRPRSRRWCRRPTGRSRRPRAEEVIKRRVPNSAAQTADKPRNYSVLSFVGAGYQQPSCQRGGRNDGAWGIAHPRQDYVNRLRRAYPARRFVSRMGGKRHDRTSLGDLRA